MTRHSDEGFSLLEVLITLVLTSLLIAMIAALVVSVDRMYLQLNFEATAMQDGWIFRRALAADIRSAEYIYVRGSVLNVLEDDGVAYTYRWEPVSGFVERSVNGYGTAIVSTKVKSVRFLILPREGVKVALEYAEGRYTVGTSFVCIFAKGPSGG